MMETDGEVRLQNDPDHSPPDLLVEDGPSHEPRSRSILQLYRRTRSRVKSRCNRFYNALSRTQKRIPYVRTLPLPSLLIILLLVFVDLVVWLICGVIIAYKRLELISTCALAYSLGLRHALDADHISAIDLMTRRLIASGQRPVTVGTYFSLGHSTIVIITSIVVAATAAGISRKFDGISNVGNIIGSAVSSAFLIFLGLINGYILYKLIQQMRKVIQMSQFEASLEGLKLDGSGPIYRLLRLLFRLIDRPWKMYPVGVIFGLGFDTSSEIALLGISSIQGAKGTSIWLIMAFPVLFTAGMCLVDTIDGALMLALYTKPMDLAGFDNRKVAAPQRDHIGPPPDAEHGHHTPNDLLLPEEPDGNSNAQPLQDSTATSARAKDPLLFLYYSTVLTCLTVVVALVIGTIQLLTLIQAVTNGTGQFWNGIIVAGDWWEVIGGCICGSFIIVGIISVLCYRPFRRRVERKRQEMGLHAGEEALDDGEGTSQAQSGPLRKNASQHELGEIENGETGDREGGVTANTSIEILDLKPAGK